MNLFDQSSDEEEPQKQHEEIQIQKEKTTRQDEPTTSKNEQTPARLSQRIKKNNWYRQNVMIQKLEEDEKERSDLKKSETKTEEDLRRELEAIPNFLEMTPEEIQNWINE